MMPSTMTPQLCQAALDAGFTLSQNVSKVVKFSVTLRHVEVDGKKALIPAETEVRHALCGFPLLVTIDGSDYKRRTLNRIDYLEKVE